MGKTPDGGDAVVLHIKRELWQTTTLAGENQVCPHIKSKSGFGPGWQYSSARCLWLRFYGF
jgi:hypothetical protein